MMKKDRKNGFMFGFRYYKIKKKHQNFSTNNKRSLKKAYIRDLYLKNKIKMDDK